MNLNWAFCFRLLSCWLWVIVTSSGMAADVKLNLAGTWRFRMDPEDVGVRERWFETKLPNDVELPGTLQSQGYGEAVSTTTEWTGSIVDRSWFTDTRYEKYRKQGDVKIPFWLQPEEHYVGAAWYQRDVNIPGDWSDKAIRLHLERVHWVTRVWVDDICLGSEDSLSTPHEYTFPEDTAPGRHTITVRVDNRLAVDVGVNAHSVSDHTQSNWNGMVGDLALTAHGYPGIEDVQIYPDVPGKKIRVAVHLANDRVQNVEKQRGVSGRDRALVLSLQVKALGKDADHEMKLRTYPLKGNDQDVVEVDYKLEDPLLLWDEFAPNLYELAAALSGKSLGVRRRKSGDDSKEILDERREVFGFRELSTAGTQFTINGRKIFLRGTLECCIFPRTGHPSMRVSDWKRIFDVIKDHGLNHMRFHSWCPPEAAFRAADEEGVYLQVECAAWTRLGDGEPVDEWIHREAERILQTYGNHPSFALMAYGNEPGGKRQREYLSEWVSRYKKRDSRRLYTSAAGWPALQENQFHSTPKPRIQGWGQGLASRINALPPETCFDYEDFVSQYSVPVVSHEIGQWCVYPNFQEIPKYTGVLKPKNFEIFRDTLSANHMGGQAMDFLMASGKLQILCYKAEIEAALRTRGLGGFQLLDLHDFPGQGTALVGILDPFWEPKPYVNAEEYRRFCDTTVPLARMRKRIWTSSETFAAQVEVFHFGPSSLKNVLPHWRVWDEKGEIRLKGEMQRASVDPGSLTELGPIEIDLTALAAPSRYRLTVTLAGMEAENDWDFWVFPDAVDTTLPEGVLLSERLDKRALARLGDGGTVLLMPPAEDVDTPVKIGFSSIFWNTAWTRGQPPHTLGILCDPSHPALQAFPTEFHTNWQWWELIHGSAAAVLDGLPPNLRPIVQPIDTWFENRRLGLLFEAKVGGGNLLVCTMDLRENLASRPAARQMLHSLSRYLAGPLFKPTHQLCPEAIHSLLKEPSLLRTLGARVVEVDSEADGYEGPKAIDNDPKTIWHTQWGQTAPSMPHHLVIDLGRIVTLRGVRYLPRQDMANGRIAKYQIYVRENLDHWGDPAASGVWPNRVELARVTFQEPVRGRYIKLEALSEVNGNLFAAVAELDIDLVDSKVLSQP